MADDGEVTDRAHAVTESFGPLVRGHLGCVFDVADLVIVTSM